MLEKLRSLHWSLWRVLGSSNVLQVVVDGQRSAKMPSKTWFSRAPCWAWRAIRAAGFVEIVYADDLNGFKEFEHDASVDSIMAEAKKCQSHNKHLGSQRDLRHLQMLARSALGLG